jgi:hypothetical protein
MLTAPMESFVCKRCGRRNERRSALYSIHGFAAHYCDVCFAEDATGKRGRLGRLLLASVLGACVFAGAAIVAVGVGVPLAVFRVRAFVEGSVPLRAGILIVPGILLGLLLWRRRGRR